MTVRLLSVVLRLVVSFMLAVLVTLAFFSYITSNRQARDALKAREDTATAARHRIDLLNSQLNDLQRELDALLVAATETERRTIVLEANQHRIEANQSVSSTTTTIRTRPSAVTPSSVPTTTTTRATTTTTQPPGTTTTTITCVVNAGLVCLHR